MGFGVGDNVGGVVEEIVDEVFGHAGIADVAGADRRVGDDLAVGIDGDVALVAVEAPGRVLCP